MKYIALLLTITLATGGILLSSNKVEAKTSYYKSAKSGRFVSPSYSKSNKSTTYRSYRY